MNYIYWEFFKKILFIRIEKFSAISNATISYLESVSNYQMVFLSLCRWFCGIFLSFFLSCGILYWLIFKCYSTILEIHLICDVLIFLYISLDLLIFHFWFLQVYVCEISLIFFLAMSLLGYDKLCWPYKTSLGSVVSCSLEKFV